MSNTYFQFKQFTIHQQHCAMKVCTEACLFGAWLANRVKNYKPGTFLDIGAGTGLLSLMLAQQVSATIDAVEADAAAAGQATENIQASPWQQTLQVYQTPIQQYEPGKLYDGIFSNPPFFINSLESPNAQRNIALHGAQLSLDELVHSATRLIKPGGWFAVLLPYETAGKFVRLAGLQHWFVAERVNVRQTEKHDYFRSMLLLHRSETEPQISEITIKIDQAYSPAFVHLLKEYYLYL